MGADRKNGAVAATPAKLLGNSDTWISATSFDSEGHMFRIWKYVVWGIQHRVTTLITALAMMAGSLWEVGGNLLEDIATLNFQTAHGVLLFGTVEAIRSARELLEGKGHHPHGAAEG